MIQPISNLGSSAAQAAGVKEALAVQRPDGSRFSSGMYSSITGF